MLIANKARNSQIFRSGKSVISFQSIFKFQTCDMCMSNFLRGAGTGACMRCKCSGNEEMRSREHH